MTQITWKNVDAPDFTGALKGVEMTNTLLGKALDSAGAGIDQFQKMKQDAADRAVQGRINALSFDPAGMKQAMLNGTLAGPDEMNMSADMLARLPNQVDSAIAGTKAIDAYTRDADLQQKEDSLIPAFNEAMNAVSAGGFKNAEEFLNSEVFRTLPAVKQQKYRSDLQSIDSTGLTSQNLRPDDAARRAEEQRQKDIANATARLNQILDPNVKAQEVQRLREQVGPDGKTPLYEPRTIEAMAAGAGVAGGANAVLGKTADALLPQNPSDIFSYADVAYGGGAINKELQTLGDVTDPKNVGLLKDKNGKIEFTAGIWQLRRDTIADFAPKVFGEDNWRNQDLRDPVVQEKISKAVFESTKGKGNLLAGRWTSLAARGYTQDQIDAIAKMPWDQAKGILWQAEHGITNTSAKATETALKLSVSQNQEMAKNTAAAGLFQRMADTSQPMDVVNAAIKDGTFQLADGEPDNSDVINALNIAMKRGGDGSNPLSAAMAMDLLKNSQKAAHWWLPDDKTGDSTSVDWGAFDKKAAAFRSGDTYNAAIQLQTMAGTQKAIVDKNAELAAATKQYQRIQFQANQGTLSNPGDLASAKALVSALDTQLQGLVGQSNVSFKPKDTKTVAPAPDAPTPAAAKLGKAVSGKVPTVGSNGAKLHWENLGREQRRLIPPVRPVGIRYNGKEYPASEAQMAKWKLEMAAYEEANK